MSASARGDDVIAKKKKTTRRRKAKPSLTDMAIGYGNLTLITEAVLGTSPIGFFKGDHDIKSTTTSGQWSEWNVGGMTTTSAADGVSMADMLNDPALSFNLITSNARTNAVGLVFNAILFNTGAKILKSAIKGPVREANKLIRPLGLPVRL